MFLFFISLPYCSANVHMHIRTYCHWFLCVSGWACDW